MIARVVATAALLCGLAAGGTSLAPAVRADPAMPSCPLAVRLLCSVLPVAPDLDGDVDYTQHGPDVDGGNLAPEAGPPTDPCASGCI